MNYVEREEQKEIGHRILADASKSGQHVAALHSVVRAYYYRNTDAPSFRSYAAHFLWANAKNYPTAAVRKLQSNFGFPRRPRIHPGYSDWNSYVEPGRITT